MEFLRGQLKEQDKTSVTIGRGLNCQLTTDISGHKEMITIDSINFLSRKIYRIELLKEYFDTAREIHMYVLVELQYFFRFVLNFEVSLHTLHSDPRLGLTHPSCKFESFFGPNAFFRPAGEKNISDPIKISRGPIWLYFSKRPRSIRKVSSK